MQHHRHDGRHDHQDEERVRHPEAAPRREPGQGVQPLRVAEADGRVAGVVARRAAVDQQAAKGHDEGLQLGARHQHAVQRPDQQPAHQHEQQRQRPGHAVIRQQIDEHDPQQRKDRADRQVNAAGDDDQALPDAEHPEQPDQVRHVQQVHRRQEARVERRRDRADHQHQHEKAELFLVHAQHDSY